MIAIREELKRGLNVEHVIKREENIMRKRENDCFLHLLLFQQCFPKGFFLGVVKTHDCKVKAKTDIKCSLIRFTL